MVAKNKLNKKVLLFIKALISFSILYWLSNFIDFEGMRVVWRDASKAYLFLLPIPALISLYFYSVRWGRLLGSYGMHLSFGQRYSYYMIGYFFNTCMPGNLGGDVVRVGFAAAALKRRYLALATVSLIERCFGLCAVLILGSVGFLACYKTHLQSIPEEVYRLLFVLPALFIGGILCFRPLAALAGKIIVRLGRFSRLGQFLRETSELKNSQVVIAVGLSVLGQLAGTLSAVILFKVLHMSVPFTGYLFIFAILSLAMLVPISLGGLGVREGLLTVLLAGFGVSAETAVSFALVGYIARVVIGTVGGLVYLFTRDSINFKKGVIEDEKLSD